MSFPLIYASVPGIACKGKCTASCGPIAAHAAEVEHFERVTGKPFPDGAKMLDAWLKGSAMVCPHLNPIGQCAVHQHRPLICRLWGVAEGMPCKWGCVPERVLPDSEASALLRMTEAG